MRKLVIVIVILGIIFVGMMVYTNEVKQKDPVSVQEIEKIEKYLNQIYMWQEVTEESLPEFEEINQASEMWIWEVVKKNIEDYELSYEQIQEKAKELFGEKFTKKLNKEETKYFNYDQETNRYYATEVELDEKEDTFLLSNVDKIEGGYEVEIIEYIEDYSQTNKEGENDIIIRNCKGEEIGKVSIQEEAQAKELAKNKKEQLNEKKIMLKEQNGKLFIEKVQRK